MDSTMFDFMLERAHHWPVYAKKIIDSTKWSLVDSNNNYIGVDCMDEKLADMVAKVINDSAITTMKEPVPPTPPAKPVLEFYVAYLFGLPISSADPYMTGKNRIDSASDPAYVVWAAHPSTTIVDVKRFKTAEEARNYANAIAAFLRIPLEHAKIEVKKVTVKEDRIYHFNPKPS